MYKSFFCNNFNELNHFLFCYCFFYCDRYLLMKMEVSSYSLQDLSFYGNQCNSGRNSSLSASSHIQVDMSCRKCISWNLCFNFIFSIWYKSLVHWKIAKPIFCFILKAIFRLSYSKHEQCFALKFSWLDWLLECYSERIEIIYFSVQ